tara:strand:- start:99 stop:221 length:123 start_codon:yes stop_codon:yes gene_type:complete
METHSLFPISIMDTKPSVMGQNKNIGEAFEGSHHNDSKDI